MKNIWIMNHYASGMYEDRGGRHYWFAENLFKKDYRPVIFCANTLHNSSRIIEVNGRYKVDDIDGIHFILVKVTKYAGNGLSRIINMLSFYKNLFRVAKNYAKKDGKPDVILASSVHPLTMVAGIKIAKKFKIPCICEVRDLWPESLVAYGLLKRTGILAKLLYQGEKWIYKKADAVIMTWEGGREYIKDQGFDKQIDLNKIKYINNGVDIEAFDKNSQEYILQDNDLNNKNYKNIIYAGAIRKVNNLGALLDAAKLIQDKGLSDIRFLIYGEGSEREALTQRCKNENISNVIFKGKVNKKYIPYIVKSAYINLIHNVSTSLNKYGQSQNKLFEYLAAGRCIIQTYSTGYSVFDRAPCGICIKEQSPAAIAEAIVRVYGDEKNRLEMGKAAREISFEYDFKVLTDKLIDIIKNL